MVERVRPAGRVKGKRGIPIQKGQVLNPKGRPAGALNRVPKLLKDTTLDAMTALGKLVPVYAQLYRKGEPVFKQKLDRHGQPVFEVVVSDDGEDEISVPVYTDEPVYTQKVLKYEGTGEGGILAHIESLIEINPQWSVVLLCRLLPLQVEQSGEVMHTVTSRFGKTDVTKMTLEELNAAFHEAVGLTKPLLPRQIASQPSMIEGEVVEEQAA